MPESDRARTVRSLMKSAIVRLQESGFDEARLTVELLLAHVLHCQRIALYTDSNRSLAETDAQGFDELLARRMRHEPLQYIVGSTSFMGLPFRVDKRVLIPRPETETLVEQVMIDLKERPDEAPSSVLDIGTGCGCIAVAVRKFVQNASVTALDGSADALEVARLNARVHGLESELRFVFADLFGPIEEILTVPFTHIVSNPPYASAAEWETLEPEIRDFEPRQAVSDGADGFRFHRRIAELAPSLLAEDGKVFLEVGWGQADEVRRILAAHGAVETGVIADLQDVARVVTATFRPVSRPRPSRN